MKKQPLFVVPLITLLSLTLMACNGGSSSSPEGGNSGKPGSGQSNDGSQQSGPLESWQSSTLGQEGHGGDAVVCFNIPVDQAVQKVSASNSQQTCPQGSEPCMITSPGHDGQSGSSEVWKMTSQGRQNIRSAKPLEQFLAEKIESKKVLIDRLNQMPLEEGYRLLLTPMTKLPGAFKQLINTHYKMGWLHEDGIASEYGLRDIQDSGFIDEADMDKTHCKELQAVVRRDQQLWYDADIIKHFDTAGRVLIQLHEEIYSWGVALDQINLEVHYPPAHETSIKTRRLILKILDQNLTEQALNENLKSHGFSIMHWGTLYNVPTSQGYYMDTQSCLIEQQSLRKAIEGFPSGRDFWLETAEYMSKRYLKDEHGPEVLLRHNFPLTLSNMISYTFDVGNSQDFRYNLMTLLSQFEHPTTCEGTFN